MDFISGQLSCIKNESCNASLLDSAVSAHNPEISADNECLLRASKPIEEITPKNSMRKTNVQNNEPAFSQQ